MHLTSQRTRARTHTHTRTHKGRTHTPALESICSRTEALLRISGGTEVSCAIVLMEDRVSSLTSGTFSPAGVKRSVRQSLDMIMARGEENASAHISEKKAGKPRRILFFLSAHFWEVGGLAQECPTCCFLPLTLCGGAHDCAGDQGFVLEDAVLRR